MATKIYLANAPKIAQVDTLTPGGTIAVGNTFTVTINGKAITYTATGTTVASVCTGLYTLLAACQYPEFLEITWADATTAITATSKVAGRTFTLGVSKAQGGGGTDTHTFSASTTTANSGPSDIGVAGNYSGGTLPASDDTVICENLTVDLLYNLDALDGIDGVTFKFINCTSKLGLDEYNPSGYDEYRPTTFACGIVAAEINSPSSSRIKIDVLDPGAPCTFVVNGTSKQSTTPGLEALLLKGGTATNHIDLYVNRGSVGVAVLAGDTASIGAMVSGQQTNQTSDVSIRLGAGVTFEDDAYTVLAGKVESNSDVGTITAYENTTVKVSAGEVDTLIENRDGTVIFNGATPVAEYIGYGSATLDLRQRTTPIVFTDMTLYKGHRIIGGEGLFSTTNPVAIPDGNANDVTWPKDKNITVAIAAA